LANTAKELRSALYPWIIVSLLLAIILYIATLWVPEGWTRDVVSAIASSLISVGVALLITDVVLKPVYTRDVLNVAGLNEEVHQSGLESIRRMSQARLGDLIANSHKITICASVSMAERVWPDVLEASAIKPTQVRLYLITPADATWRGFESSWKEKACEARGSSLVISLSGESMPILTVDTETQCVVAVSDGSSSSGNPLIMQFSKKPSDPYIDALGRFVERVRDADTVPFYESKAEA